MGDCDDTINSLFYFNDTQSILKFSKPIHAWAYYLDKKIDLLTQKVFPCSSQELLDHFFGVALFAPIPRTKPRIIHLNYNFGHILYGAHTPCSTPLCIDLEYECVEPFIAEKPESEIVFEVHGPSFEEYAPRFQQCYEALLRGDSYQLNLTAPFVYEFKQGKISDVVRTFFSRPRMMGAYAHSTVIPCLNFGLLSNSPECLFQASLVNAHAINLWSMPIKGTLKVSNEIERKRINQQLLHDKKNQNELFIIIDLIRNDLSKIEHPKAKLLEKKIPLSVPGLAHMASLISVELSRQISLGKILAALFPGGSITGAPKKRTMEILDTVENYDRGFYTGSTIFLWKKAAAASINIRTLQLDLNKKSGVYGSGGGITLRSEVCSEYDEMVAKVASFMGPLKLK
ncbi:MAG: chorismate-binding protein [Bdellovibrio sp.]|nr:chorismate-binding protein [Bdellovibrio sp.]